MTTQENSAENPVDTDDATHMNLDSGTEPADVESPEAGSESVEMAPERGLFNKVVSILGQGGIETAKVEALTLAGRAYAMTQGNVIRILSALDDTEKMTLIEKGVTGIELSTFKKILLVVNPNMVVMPEVLSAVWANLKRKVMGAIPEAWLPEDWRNDLNLFASQPEVVTVLAMGLAQPQSPAVGQAAEKALANFLQNTGRVARVAEVGGAMFGQVEVVEGAEMVTKGVKIGNEVLTLFPKVRANMEAGNAEVANTQVEEHDEVAVADGPGGVEPLAANNNKHYQGQQKEAA